MKKILVIEDDPAISLGLAMFLKGENFDVIKSDDGRLGYELALREKPEIIILDVNLPSMDGIQVCRMLRENGFQNPVIILTSKAEKIDKVVGLEIGADDYVTKPFDSRELLARIRTNLRRIENTQSNFSVSDDKKLQRHLLAIMFTDMTDYSKKMNQDEILALRLLQDHNKIMNESILNYKGRVIEIIGDAFLAAFESAIDCLNCCIYIRERFEEYNSAKPKFEKIKIRTGLHVGDVIEYEGKLKGDALNITARFQELAEPGSIYISENFYMIIRGKTKVELKKLKTVRLKHIKGDFNIYTV